jgi:hypothetical protein
MANDQLPSNIPNKRPTSRTVSMRGLVFAIAGKEQPYDVYRFSGVPKFEKPNHNPFKDL